MTAPHIEQRELTEQRTAVMRSTLAVGEIGSFMERALSAVARVLATQDLSPSGPPFARYHRIGGDEFEVEAGFPTEGSVSSADEVLASSLPGGAAAVLLYVGPYDEMEAAYGALSDWVSQRGGVPQDPWEVYLSDPAQEPDPKTWRTEIVMPFRI